MKNLFKISFFLLFVISFSTQATETKLSKIVSDRFNVGLEYQDFIKTKVQMHLVQKERIKNFLLPPVNTINLTPYMKTFAIFSADQTKLLDMFQPYCESESSPYGGFCMGSDVELTNWMIAHRNHYEVMKEVIIKWVELLDSTGKVDGLKDFEEIRIKYQLANAQFYPLVAFIGLDDNGIQYDRFLEILLNFNETENYVRYFGLLYDIATINRDLPDFAIGKISYSLRTGTSKILPSRVNQKKTYKDFSLFGIACLALNKKIQKNSILSTTKLMTAGYEILKLRNWSASDWENPSKKINIHLEEAKSRADVTEEIITKASMCI